MLYPRQKRQLWTMKIFDFSKEIDRDAFLLLMLKITSVMRTISRWNIRN